MIVFSRQDSLSSFLDSSEHLHVLVGWCQLLAGVNFSDFAAACNHKVAKIILTLLTIFTVTAAYHKNLSISDQSSNTHFHNYALGILDPLPKNSLMFINYDQQWTSTRYVQECEGFCKDVTSINLSMMSYPWWKTKHFLERYHGWKLESMGKYEMEWDLWRVPEHAQSYGGWKLLSNSKRNLRSS